MINEARKHKPIEQLTEEQIEEAVEKHWRVYSYTDYGTKLYGSTYRDGFKAAAKWMQEQTK